jgi:hypothetical protein
MSTSLDSCPHCGGHLIGDGHTDVVHCENVTPCGNEKPDAAPLVKAVHHTRCYTCLRWHTCPPCLRGTPHDEDPDQPHCYRDIPAAALPSAYPWSPKPDANPIAPRSCEECNQRRQGCKWRGGFINGVLVPPPPESLSCFLCAEREQCFCADDPYNTDGDCLASK